MFTRSLVVFFLIVSFGLTTSVAFAATDDDGNGRTYVESVEDLAADKAFDQQAAGPATLTQAGPIQVTPAPIQGAGIANKPDGTVVMKSGDTGDISLSPELKAKLDALTVLEKRLRAAARRNTSKKRSGARSATKPVVATSPAPAADPATPPATDPATNPATPPANPAAPVQGTPDFAALANEVAAIKAEVTANKGLSEASSAKLDSIAATLAALQPSAVEITPEQLEEIQVAARAAVRAEMAEISWYSKWGFWLSVIAIVLIVIGIIVVIFRTRQRESADSNDIVTERLDSLERLVRDVGANIRRDIGVVDAKVVDAGNAVVKLAEVVQDFKSEFGNLQQEFRLLSEKIAGADDLEAEK